MKLPWSSKCSVKERIKCVSARPEGDPISSRTAYSYCEGVVFVTAKEIEENLGQTLKFDSLNKNLMSLDVSRQ
jgi:hypothetical protein